MQSKHITKIATAALIGAMAFAAAGCSGSGSEDPVSIGSSQTTITKASGESGQGGNPAQSSDVYSFTYSGTKITVNTDVAPVVAALGEPTKYFESESCAYQGLDKTYVYPLFTVYTYPSGTADMISSIELKADAVTTEEGIRIGSTKDEVTAAYGAPSEETGSVIKYKKGDAVLSFVITDNAVTGIVYDYARLKTA